MWQQKRALSFDNHTLADKFLSHFSRTRDEEEWRGMKSVAFNNTRWQNARHLHTYIPYVGVRDHYGRFRLELREGVRGGQSILHNGRPRQMIDWSYDELRVGVHVRDPGKKKIKGPRECEIRVKPHSAKNPSLLPLSPFFFLRPHKSSARRRDNVVLVLYRRVTDVTTSAFYSRDIRVYVSLTRRD